ncbi:(deoxy)nucleoside triphosphate pyrophosphohydrolase [Leptolyngbya sp. 15MV]|nr:(deoxy)nucleoside triphosphate pyrophosphohydrolase [Leptolyngbya sp. 15MV]
MSKVEGIPTWIAVVAAALHGRDGRWLMHRRPLGKHHGGLWEFPGGKVESEEIPQVALIREIEEELGITLDPGALRPAAFAEGERDRQGREIVILLYTCDRWTGEPAALEGGGIGWFSPGEAALLAKPPLDRMLADRLFANRDR